MRELPPPVFSRRSFLFFIVLAPACLLAVAAIVLTLQYRQFQALVSPTSTVAPPRPLSEGRESAAPVLASIARFTEGAGPDTLALSPDDLNRLAAASTVLRREQIRFRFSAGLTTTPNLDVAESLLVVESSRTVTDLNGKVAWIFKRISPIADGWLNARMEGLVELKKNDLAFAPERGFMNLTKVPKAAMTKRGGMSPRDFIEASAAPRYAAFVAVLDTAYWNGRAVVLVRAEDAVGTTAASPPAPAFR